MLHRIEKKIASVRKDLNLLGELKPLCEEKFLIDPVYQGALLHYLYKVADNSISLAEMLVKYKELPKPQSYYESIDLLGEYRLIPPEFAYDFAKIASFRNFLAHHYENIDYRVICYESLEKIDEIEEYLTYIENALP